MSKKKTTGKDVSRPRAGEAYMKAIEGDAKAQAGLRRTKAKLAAFAAGVKPLAELEAGRKAVIEKTLKPFAILSAAHKAAAEAVALLFKEAFNSEEVKRAEAEAKACMAKVAEEYKLANETWEAYYGERYPESIEDLQRLAARAGVSADKVLEGNWTAADVLPLIEGYLQRRADQVIFHEAGRTARKSDKGGPGVSLAPLIRSMGTGKRTSFKVKDKWGERALIVPETEPPWAGDPTRIVLQIEALTGTRLKDGENPSRFFRLYERDYKENRDPAAPVSFADFVARLHSDWIDVVPTGQADTQGAGPTPATNPPAKSPYGYLSPAELAEQHGLDSEALRKRLERWRRKHMDGWIENTERKPTEAQFLYAPSVVESVIQQAKKASGKTSGKTSGKRPA